MTKDYINSFLTENEQLAVQQFAGSEVMREAVKKVLLAGLYQNGTLEKGKDPKPLYNGALSFVSGATGDLTNEQAGSYLRALWEGLNALEEAFNAMKLYQTPERSEENPNPAR